MILPRRKFWQEGMLCSMKVKHGIRTLLKLSKVWANWRSSNELTKVDFDDSPVRSTRSIDEIY
ncbi:hypothetical protein EPI10_000627 [Gossypium australe]|uniref:Uncharacterized protein n=1 Tax=Gossypium australe TaxID=47621 RepID=A0A5B6V8H7_9ROSI|nr:hypothetical protein EPI10_000627 [Gossypium australe]